MQTQIKNGNSIKLYREQVTDCSLNGFVDFFTSDEFWGKNLWCQGCQFDYIDNPDQMKFDFIGRFEYFERDVRRLLNQLGCDVKDVAHELDRGEAKRHEINHLGDLYSPEAIKKIGKRYQQDFEEFGYDLL